MKDLPGAEFRDRAVYLTEEDTLVIADLHLGRGYSAGVEVPVDAAATVNSRLEGVLEYWDPDRVVLAGDVLDAFETVPPGVESRLGTILEAIRSRGAETVVLGGNHDVLLSTLFDGPIGDHHRVGETTIAHGHEPVPPDADRYVVGHQHPAVRIEGVKRHCYLVGPSRDGGTVIVLPAFSPAVRGTTMNHRRGSDIDRGLIPEGAIDRFRPVVRDEPADETLIFPPFARLRPFL